MPTTFDEDDEDFDEREYPEDDEADWNLDPATIACPYCGGDIVEDSQWCPHCKQYISQEDAASAKITLAHRGGCRTDPRDHVSISSQPETELSAGDRLQEPLNRGHRNVR